MKNITNNRIGQTINFCCKIESWC